MIGLAVLISILSGIGVIWGAWPGPTNDGSWRCWVWRALRTAGYLAAVTAAVAITTLSAVGLTATIACSPDGDDCVEPVVAGILTFLVAWPMWAALAAVTHRTVAPAMSVRRPR